MNCMRKPQSIFIARTTRYTFSIVSVGPTPKADPPQIPTMHCSANVGKDGDTGEYTRNVRKAFSTCVQASNIVHFSDPIISACVSLVHMR